MIPFKQKQTITSSICSLLHWNNKYFTGSQMIYLISILLSSNKFNGELIAFLLYIWKCCIIPCGSNLIEKDYNKPNIRNFCLQTSSSSLCCCIALNYKLKFKWDKTQVCGTKKFSPPSHVVQSILVYLFRYLFRNIH